MRELIDEEELRFLEKEYRRTKSGGKCPAWDLEYVALACEAVPKLIEEDIFLREAVNTEIDRNESLSFTLFSKVKENDHLQKMVEWMAAKLVERGHVIGDISSPSFTKNWVDAARKASENEA